MKSTLFIQVLFENPSEKIGWGHGSAQRNWNKSVALQSVVKNRLRGLSEQISVQVSAIPLGYFVAINHRQAD